MNRQSPASRRPTPCPLCGHPAEFVQSARTATRTLHVFACRQHATYLKRGGVDVRGHYTFAVDQAGAVYLVCGFDSRQEPIVGYVVKAAPSPPPTMLCPWCDYPASPIGRAPRPLGLVPAGAPLYRCGNDGCLSSLWVNEERRFFFRTPAGECFEVLDAGPDGVRVSSNARQPRQRTA